MSDLNEQISRIVQAFKSLGYPILDVQYTNRLMLFGFGSRIEAETVIEIFEKNKKFDWVEVVTLPGQKCEWYVKCELLGDWSSSTGFTS